MQNVRRLECGVDVVSLTIPEFDACMNYALVNGRPYPLSIIGLDSKKVDELSVSGYNSLIDIGAFAISDDGYPELMDNIPTISNFVIAIDEMESIVTIKAIVNKNHMQFYYLHGDSTWVLMWKTKTEWYVCAQSDRFSAAVTFMELTKTIVSNMGSASVGFHFTWWAMSGEQIMDTIMHSKSDIIFVEKKPENTMLASMIEKWPNKMSLSQFAERAGSLLGVI